MGCSDIYFFVFTFMDRTKLGAEGIVSKIARSLVSIKANQPLLLGDNP